MSEPERYGTCSDGNGHWGIEDDGKVILSGLVSHDACDAVMDLLDERDDEIARLKAEVESLKEDNRQLTNAFEIAEGIIKRMGKAAEDAAKEGKQLP